MPHSQIVINVDIGEVRVALVENGIVTELHIERRGERDVVGNVYLGKVTRVLPGMNAAFVDIGLERAAFLHVEDALSEGDLRALAPDDDVPSEGDAADEDVAAARPVAEAHAEAEAEADEDGRDDDAEAGEAHADEAPATGVGTDDEPARGSDPGTAAPEAGDHGEREKPGDAAADGKRSTDADEPPPGRGGSASLIARLPATRSRAPAARRASGERSGGERRGGSGGSGSSGSGGGSGGGGSAGSGGSGGGSGGRGRHPRGRRKDAPRGDRPPRKDNGGSGGGGGNGGGGSGGGGGHERSGKPIRDLLREGQEIVVQVNKGPISTKGARCTSHVSLPGRYVVYMPTVEHIGVSKRIGNDKERKRLREAIEQLKPEKGGLIVRTASEGLTRRQLKNDVGYLVQLWGDIWKKREGAKAPALLYEELDVVLRTVRDVMGPEIEKIVIDDKEAHARCVRFVEQFMPDRKDDVVLYQGSEPVFDEYGIEDEIARALSRKVPLKSGGYLIIDQAEALTAIDVNSGRFVGKGNKDVEDTVTQTNIEAVAEIAYQLRLRNLGGLIILDLIDMDRSSNRDKVYRALNEALKQDKAKTSILRISELGLVEMTRKRTRESLGRQLYEPCFYCDGTGHTQSKITIAYEIMRQIRREKDQLAGYTITVNAHPAVADVLKHEARDVVQEAERRYMRKIVVAARPEYHIEQFDLSGR